LFCLRQKCKPALTITLLALLGCGPGDEEVKRELAERTGCAAISVRLVDEAGGRRVYQTEAKCPAGGTLTDLSHWMRTGRDQRWVRIDLATRPPRPPELD
jgi:hypothetical protein